VQQAFLAAHFGIGLLLAAMLVAGAGLGWFPDDTHRAEVPVSVRDNPASYRPIYVVYGGGWSAGGSSGGGGGFGFGK
jgi:hypothetical protein